MKKFLLFLIYFCFSIFIFSNEVIEVKGFVTEKDFKLGDATVTFYNSKNSPKKVKTNIDGSFNVQLEKNKYRVEVEKEGYTFIEGDEFFIDLIFNEYNPLILNMKSDKLIVSGKVIDDEGVPLKNSKIRVKMGVNSKTLISDEKGNFSFEGDEGLISIYVEKNGYFSNGTSLLVQNEEYINDLVVKLEKKNFYISGLISQENNFLKNEKIQLVNGSDNKIVMEIFSNEEGFYNFPDVPFLEDAYFVVPDLKYRSENFQLTEDLRQFNLFL